MLKRKVILSRDSVLWYAGDPAASFAIVESGKLGVKTEKGLVSVLWPNMVLGDTSLLTLEGGQPKRLATIYALEEGTTVIEYPPGLVKQAEGEPGHTLWRAILTMLLGQVCRNCLVLVSAHEDKPLLARSFRGLMQPLVESHKACFDSLATWDDFSTTFRFLSETRDYTEAAQKALVGPFADREQLVKAAETTRELFKGQGALPFLVDHIEAARERWAIQDKAEAG